MANFATLDELKARLDWTLDADEERIATSALEDASDLAVAYAGRDWDPVATAPRLVRTLVLKACKRYMNNPSGYTQSRAGDETLGWSDDQGENAGTVYFTRDERDMLAELGGRKGGIVSVGVSAWNSNITRYRNRGSNDLPAGFVPSSSGADFPLYASECDEW
ncbi:head-to-tail adaptor [Streptomyces phage Janus]|uniref:Head-to-tail adaptor n=1 Tax=Streptomyces phage Janus TaxID=2510525 RepID=A0A411CQ58_9CAUD|nr:head-tail adaptor Ad1 [Streptomyces phage Janus]ATI18875.1 head-to-tail adaptor [Streptomyces phage SqueakyClean]QAY15916.1 head-to-tail adaptor [Streptomyces phage Janus]QFG10680.1 head-to-tail adaptor [Streptomyces phage Animus]